MADQIEPSFILTKDHIRRAFGYLEETQDLDKRNIFFTKYMVENVEWQITGREHSMAGTRHSVAEHTAASFARLRVKIVDPIKFVIRSIIMEPESLMASIELYGYATKLDGNPYDNDYVWITWWNKEGKIVRIRSYHDTDLAEKVLNE